MDRLTALSGDELMAWDDWTWSLTEDDDLAEQSARDRFEETRRERDAAADAVIAGRRGAVIDWRACPHVWINAERVSGAVCFKGTRLPVGHLIENLRAGLTVAEFVEVFDADPEQVRAVLQWIRDGFEAARAVPEAERLARVECAALLEWLGGEPAATSAPPHPGETAEEARARSARNVDLILRQHAAMDAGDKAEAGRLFALQVLDADIFLTCKRIMGADWIRQRGLDTHLADAAYGPGWLDEDETT